jgi:hypothetical protein
MRTSLIYSRESSFFALLKASPPFPLRYLLLPPLFPFLPVEQAIAMHHINIVRSWGIPQPMPIIEPVVEVEPVVELVSLVDFNII